MKYQNLIYIFNIYYLEIHIYGVLGFWGIMRTFRVKNNLKSGVNFGPQKSTFSKMTQFWGFGQGSVGFRGSKFFLH